MPIQVLPPQLANQIAAGEVVERPASVVKELVENSLDAGATRIDIDIERGGAKLIRIRDNGCGIKKDELALALARHATSKIASLDDLEAIISLGFRGEALASISSVSRLTLTSRTADQQEAWQAYAEGRDMDVTVKPAAHPVGTTLEVLDLFYNTPARRKFMRTEKTEFGHIDEIIRRIALARFDVTLNLSHNGKVMRQYRAVAEGGQKERRLGAICGTPFLEKALAIEWQHGDLALRGWVADPNASSAAFAEIQYCYVNGRMMRDRLINHAIRQACEDKLGADQQPAFVLYLEIDPHQVDVNVHPAKHEVRFHQSRLVHDFIYQGVAAVLQQQAEPELPLGLKISPEETGVLRRVQTQLAEMGIEIVLDAQHVTIRAVPLPLRQQNLQNLIPELIGYLAQQTTFDAADTAQWIARHLASEHAPWSMAQAITVLAEVERLCPQLVKAPPGGLLQPVDLQTAMTALKHD
ncbi:DNA mismatch repair endonuclease MutL [Enterobacter hormaechei]|nr:DNA mismatch repair endonuclease MutL [Enterobacter hormaechei]